MEKVALVSSKSYASEAKNATMQAVKLVGGIEKIVQPGDVVLIKPNLVVAQEGDSGNVTHFLLIEQLIKMSHAAGANKIFVGEGSGNADTMKAMETSGIKHVVDKLGHRGVPVELKDLNYDKNPDTNQFDTINLGASSKKRTYRVAHTALISDVIISVPKMKSHNGTGITVALKNMIGVAPGGYYGFPKKAGRVEALPHTSLEYTRNPKNSLAMYNVIVQTIIDLNKIVLGMYPDSSKKKRYLAVVDGVVAGAYDYVTSTFEVVRWKPIKVGAIIAGTDPVAVDTIASRIMCYSPERIPLIVRAAEMGLGSIKDIEVLGERVEDIRNFVPPGDNWLSIVNTQIPNLWPQMLYQNLTWRAYQALSRLHISFLLGKTINLLRQTTTNKTGTRLN